MSNVSWTNMKLHNVTFPFFITQVSNIFVERETCATTDHDQTYVDQGSAGTADRPNNSSVELRDFTFANISGDINSYQPGDGSCRTNVRFYLNQGLPNDHANDNCLYSLAGMTRVFQTSRTPKL